MDKTTHQDGQEAPLTGATAELFAGIEAGSGKRVAKALAAGASPDARDDVGSSALFLAASRPGVACARALLAAGANPEACRPWHPARTAIQRGNARLLEALLDAGVPVDAVRDGDSSLLARACGEKGATACVELLLKRGARVSTDPGDSLRHPLMCAVETMMGERVDLVVAAEPAEYWVSEKGQRQSASALCYALMLGRTTEFIGHLLRAGADPLLRTALGKSALERCPTGDLGTIAAVMEACAPGPALWEAAKKAAASARKELDGGGEQAARFMLGKARSMMDVAALEGAAGPAQDGGQGARGARRM